MLMEEIASSSPQLLISPSFLMMLGFGEGRGTDISMLVVYL